VISHKAFFAGWLTFFIDTWSILLNSNEEPSHMCSPWSLKSWNWRKTYMLFCFVVFFLHNFSLCFRMCGEREKVQQTRVRFLIALHTFEFCLRIFLVFAFVSSFANDDYLVKLLPMPKASTPFSSVGTCHIKMRRSFIVETSWRFIVVNRFWVNFQRSWRWRGILSNISENQLNKN
jgi:hypothetical protein